MLRTMRVSPRKLDLVAATDPRQEGGDGASTSSPSRKKRIAQDVKKVLKSAIANAENNHNLDVDRLIVAEASVGKGLVMKRFHDPRPRPRRPASTSRSAISRIVVRERAEAEDK